ncbi:RHS repeat-associated core domain-containing protein [Serratia sp. M24T3]|uniref:RHS repeat-associated core domain-containing protein n=1 Tax=Serratia sp. M24T3 TaxID=932213 RepID=UPI00025B9073|nr:RHS repeat-associated core domain-containing protein [Serratia sp. M24T3]EIC85448.1 hypothetical protein SPM24T3_06283 [Serratia sp. M24T3]
MNNSTLGFNGERRDFISEAAHLGNGYRAYNPILMRFNSPDSWSPFGEGGINPYAYCDGDPVNLSDPSGHMGWQSLVGIITGVIGITLMAFTLGSSMAVSASVIAGMGLAADTAGIISATLVDKNPRASAILGWTAMAFGVVSMVAGARATTISAVRSVKTLTANAVRLSRVIGEAVAEPNFVFSTAGDRDHLSKADKTLPTEAKQKSLRRMSMHASLNNPHVWAKTSQDQGSLTTAQAQEVKFRQPEDSVNQHIRSIYNETLPLNGFAGLFDYFKIRNREEKSWQKETVDIFQHIFHKQPSKYGINSAKSMWF